MLNITVIALMLMLTGLVFVGTFTIIFCGDCSQEYTAIQYMVLFFGALLSLLGIMVFIETRHNVDRVHRPRRYGI